MAKSIKVIPSTVPLCASGPALTGEKRRVAAYARVSTDRDEQFTSYEAQIDHYTHYIAGRPDWTFVSVYFQEVRLRAGGEAEKRRFYRGVGSLWLPQTTG